MHARAFPRLVRALAAANLEAFYIGSYKVLWLADSVVLITLGIVFGYLAARPSSATRPVIVLLALVPAATAALLYLWIGNFIPAHILAVAAAAAAVGGLLRD